MYHYSTFDRLLSHPFTTTFPMFSSRNRNLILGRVLARGGVMILLTTMSLPMMMKTLTMMIPLMSMVTIRIATDWTTPLTMTTTTSGLMLILRNSS